MWREQAGTALLESAQQVLETMCFVAAGEVPRPAEPVPLPIAAQVEFRGYWKGRCTVEMPESCARVIAGNFTGALDPDRIDAASMIELLCEFTNMVCGRTVTRLQCPGLVDLAPPHLLWQWPAEELPSGMSSVERWLDTGEGIVHVAFETEAAP